jgi:wyosine [tRNA(Phe)-imidazoG37] synthetase (radical SAM superfamily)
MVFLAQSSGSCIDTFIYEKSTCQSRCLFFSAPEKIRTPDTTVRSRMLYPAELLTHISWVAGNCRSLNRIDFTSDFPICQLDF